MDGVNSNFTEKFKSKLKSSLLSSYWLQLCWVSSVEIIYILGRTLHRPHKHPELLKWDSITQNILKPPVSQSCSYQYSLESCAQEMHGIYTHRIGWSCPINWRLLLSICQSRPLLFLQTFSPILQWLSWWFCMPILQPSQKSLRNAVILQCPVDWKGWEALG